MPKENPTLRSILSKMKQDRIIVYRRNYWIRFEFERDIIYRRQLEQIESFVLISVIDLKESCVTGTIKEDYRTRASKLIKPKMIIR